MTEECFIEDEEGAVIASCDLLGAEDCEIDGTSLTCECICGFGGELCEDRLSSEPYNLILGFMFAIGVTLLSLYLIKRQEDKRTDSFNKLSVHFVESRLSFVSPKVLLVFRLVCLIVYFPIIILALEGDRIRDLRTYSLLNWNMLGIYFFLASLLSLRALIKQTERNVEAGATEYIILLIQAILLPSSLFLSLVYWLVIVPSIPEEDNDRFFEVEQWFIHGVNVLMIAADFFMNDTFLLKFQFLYSCVFSSIYLVFHQYIIVYFEARREPPCPIYPFLDMSSETYIPSIAGLLFFFSAVFFIFYGLSVLKLKYTPLEEEK